MVQEREQLGFVSPQSLDQAARVLFLPRLSQQAVSPAAGLSLVADRLKRTLGRLAVIALKFDLPVFHRTARATGVLQSRGQLAQVVALSVEASDYRHQLSLRAPLSL
jgi:hypothetical protein